MRYRLAATAAFAIACGTLTAADTPVADEPDPCRLHAEQQLRKWHAAGSPRRQPPGQDGATVTHWPTDSVGVWVVETRIERATSLMRVTSTSTTEIVWSSTCAASTVEHPRAPAADPRFTDDDLRRLMAERQRGVIYVWSPHMPLSVDGLDTLRRAASPRGFAVTVVLDPGASRTFAANTAALRGWPSSTLHVADSVELTFRDMLVHAPAVLAYVNGRLVGSPFPGYHSRDEYAAYLDRAGPDRP